MVCVGVCVDDVIDTAYLAGKEKGRDDLSAHIEIGPRKASPVDQDPHALRGFNEGRITRSHVDEVDAKVFAEALVGHDKDLNGQENQKHGEK